MIFSKINKKMEQTAFRGSSNNDDSNLQSSHDELQKSIFITSRTENETKCESVYSALQIIEEKIQACSFTSIRISTTEQIEKISNEVFLLIKKLFEQPQLRLIHIESKQGKHDKNFFFWCGESRQQIFILQLKNLDNENVTNYVKEFLISSLENGHNGLLPTINCDNSEEKFYVEIFFLGDARGSLLSNAAEKGHLEHVKNLLRLGFNVNLKINEQKPIDLAYNGKHFDVVLELLKNHSTFPKNFIAQGISDELNAFVELSKLMHKSIKTRNCQKILEILTENPNQKFFYDTENNSALFTAIKYKSFEAYELLIKNNFCFGSDEIEKVLDDLEEDEDAQETLKEINERNSKPLLVPHISVLISNSWIAFDNIKDPTKISAIIELFQELDKCEVLSLILKLIATERNFKIIFDFNRNFVHFMNPMDGKGANGLFTFNGTILIAAKDLMIQNEKHKTFGIVAHELCHMAINLAFGNFARPYASNDEETKKYFSKIIHDCGVKKDREEIVKLAFIDRNVIPQELAVRYVHMLGHYLHQPQLLNEKIGDFLELEIFHKAKVVPAMEEALRKLEAKASLRCWHDLKSSEKEVIKNSLIEYSGVKVEFRYLFHQMRSKNVYEALSPQQIHLALRNDSSGLNEAFNKILHHELKLSWRNCPKILKDKILTSKIDFQGVEVEVGKILDPNSKVLFELSSDQLKNLIEGKSIEISTKYFEDLEIFIPRRFKMKSQKVQIGTEEIFCMKNATAEAFENKVFLLIDAPGSGKTTVFKNFPQEIKNLFPDFWVSFVNLKDHSEIYKKAMKILDGNCQNLIGEKILKLKGLDLKVFNELYRKGKVVFVWDAFDEVGKTFHEFLFKLFANIKNETKNIQFLSSRPEHQKELTEVLSAKVFKMIPFNEEDREIFFMQQLEDFSVEDQNEIQNKIEKFIEKVEMRADARDISNRSVNNPLMLGIIAEVLKADPALDLKNRFKIYEKFIQKQIESIKDVNRLQLLFKQNMNFYEIHQFYALKFIFGDTCPEVENLELLKRKITLTPNEVASFGLMVATSDGQLDFIHKTFAEFFVALYFIENVFKKTKIASKEEIELRIEFVLLIIYDFLSSIVVWFFLYEYLTDFHEIEEWNEDNFKTARETILKNYNDEFFDSELMRRLLMKDYELFLELLNKKHQNIFNYLSKRHAISFKDPAKPLEDTTDPKLVLEKFRKCHQIGNILFKIWFSYQFGDFSQVYLINRHTGLNLDNTALNELYDKKYFLDFYGFISKKLTEEEKAKMLKKNFLRSITFWGSDFEKLQSTWNIFTEIFDEEEMRKILVKKDINDWNILFFLFKNSHANKNSVDFILEKLEKNLTKESAQTLIRSKNKSFSSPTFFVFTCGSLDILKSYWSFVEKYLTEEEQKHHLLYELYKDKSFYDVCTRREFFYHLIPEK